MRLISGSGITSEQFIEKIRSVRESKRYKAVIIRIDSPGGDALASDLDDLQIPSSPYFPAYDYTYAQGHGQGSPPMVQEHFQCVISQLFQHMSSKTLLSCGTDSGLV
ncbi:hypothetical protein LOK49_LG02G02325 [Camellia lanceoleosa]|uniref:Uncharacterized protein n=1 Tax=Camellia lanceoleosa TaxID=1840588 RepID=A0ACC0IQV1_9ERIC|nr:hypothetical protein LOK49_LG02G02325 [Camellia lanceoleosa]